MWVCVCVCFTDMVMFPCKLILSSLLTTTSTDEGGPNVLVQQLIVEPIDHSPFTLDLTGKDTMSSVQLARAKIYPVVGSHVYECVRILVISKGTSPS